MLPKNGMKLPPKGMERLWGKYQEHDAWYSSNVDYLRSLTYTNYSRTPERRFSYYNNQDNKVREYLHVPLAADISSTSASLLLGDEILLSLPGLDGGNPNPEIVKTQARLEYIIQQGKTHSRLLEAAEQSSALGGIFIKVDWDLGIIDVPFLSVIPADMAIPTYKYGFLISACFITILDRQDEIVYRLVEDREKGKITNALYKGSEDNLGIQIPLTYHSLTRELEEEIITDIDDLLFRYLPNKLPNRQVRDIPVGRSDYAGIEHLFNAIDLTYTAWLREIRLGQARIVVPDTWLERTDPANGGRFKFDVDREIFTSMAIDPMSGEGMSVVQFDLRVEEFKNTCYDYVAKAVSMAGYSPQTFGLNIDGQAESGTALNIKERKTMKTTRQKQTFFGDDLEDLMWLLLLVDNNLNNSGNYLEEKPQVDFQDSLSFDMNRVADTLDKLTRAQAASVKTKVQLLHPAWDKAQLDQEVDAIMNEQGILDIESEDIFSMAEDKVGEARGEE